MSAIHKQQFLAEIQEANGTPFMITFVVATGKNQGQLRSKLCRYGSGAPGPKPKASNGAPTIVRKARAKHLESNTLPLTDVNAKKIITPLISHIISYNARRIIH